MIVQCPSCSARYRINASNIPEGGGKIRCPSCQNPFVVYPTQDSTSVVTDVELSELVGQSTPSAGPPPLPKRNEDTATTEMVSAEDLVKFQAVPTDDDFELIEEDEEDGTVEIQNPFKIWDDLQKHASGNLPSADSLKALGQPVPPADDEEEFATEILDANAVRAAISANPFASHEQSEVEEDADPTEIVNVAEALASLEDGPPTNQEPQKSPSLPQNTLRQHSPFSPPQSNLSGAQSPPVNPHASAPQNPPVNSPFSTPQNPPTGNPQLTNPVSSNPSGWNPTPSPAQNALPPLTTAPAAAQTPSSPTPNPGYHTPNPAVRHSTGPIGPDQNNSGFQPQSQLPASAPAAVPNQVVPAAVPSQNPQPSFQPVTQNDAGFDGPWSLRTNFGLTYEFPDTRSLNGWIQSRDDVTGYQVSNDGTNFLPFSAFPQITNRNTTSGSFNSAVPSSGVSNSGNFNAVSNSGSFSAASNSGSFGAVSSSGPHQPVSAPQQTGYDHTASINQPYDAAALAPPEKSSVAVKVMWVVCLFSAVVMFLAAAEALDLVNFVGPQQQVETPKPQSATPSHNTNIVALLNVEQNERTRAYLQ